MTSPVWRTLTASIEADLRHHAVQAGDAEQAGEQVIDRGAVVGVLEQHLGYGVADRIGGVGIQPADPQQVFW
jgi:hypothetical protein